MCDFCRLVKLMRRYAEEDVALVHHGDGGLVVFVNNTEVRRWTDMPTECLCGQHV